MLTPMTVHKPSTQSGSALIALAAIMSILGVMLAFGIDSFKVKSSQDRFKETEDKIATISHALDAFAQRTNRLPCPGNPANTYTSSNYGVGQAGGAGCLNPRGDVPVVQLRLPYDYMYDSWGRRIQYSPSRVFADPTYTVMTQVHVYCRVDRVWIYDEKMCPLTPAEAGYPRPYNVNPDKARFCCPDNSLFPTSGDIQIRLRDGTVVGRQRSANAADYAADNVYVDRTLIPARTNPHQIETTAYVIVSFGANGPGGVVAGSDEAENADADDDYIDNVRNLSDSANYFDDIILTRTQFQVMAELNSGTCTRPYYNFSPDVTCP